MLYSEIYVCARSQNSHSKVPSCRGPRGENTKSVIEFGAISVGFRPAAHDKTLFRRGLFTRLQTVSNVLYIFLLNMVCVYNTFNIYVGTHGASVSFHRCRHSTVNALYRVLKTTRWKLHFGQVEHRVRATTIELRYNILHSTIIIQWFLKSKKRLGK